MSSCVGCTKRSICWNFFFPSMATRTRVAARTVAWCGVLLIRAVSPKCCPSPILGDVYENGVGVAKDAARASVLHQKASALYQKGCEEGLRSACDKAAPLH